MSRKLSLIIVAIILPLTYLTFAATDNPDGSAEMPDMGGAVFSPTDDDTLIWLTQWPISEGGNGHLYGILPMELTWHEADSLTNYYGMGIIEAYMATISCQAENDFIVSHLLQGRHQPNPYDIYWLGGHYLDTEWVWGTTEPFQEYTNWAPGEPFESWHGTALAMWGTDSSKALGPAGTWCNAPANDQSSDLHKCWTIVEYGPPNGCPQPDTLINLTQWRDEDGGNNHWYAVIPRGASWDELLGLSSSYIIDGYPGHPATVLSFEENDFIYRNVLPPSPNDSLLYLKTFYWLGARCGFAGWSWITGEPWTYDSFSVMSDSCDGAALAIVGPGWDINPPMEGSWVGFDPFDTIQGMVVEFGPLELEGPPDTLILLTKWYSEAGGNDHWYGILPRYRNWYEADSAASQFEMDGVRGHLATVSSEAENTFIEGLHLSWTDPNECNSAWIGGNAFDSSWGWVTGEPFDYTNWKPGFDPDSLGSNQAMIMEGMSYICDFSIAGTWVGRPPLTLAPEAIVEFDALGSQCDTFINLVQWIDTLGGNNHWYAVIPCQEYWNDAKEHAGAFELADRPAYLATVTSAAENQFILDHVLSGLHNTSILDQYWLGGYDARQLWSWVTGEPFEYANWGEGEPNNVGIETALGMWGPTVTDPRRVPGQWNNSLPDGYLHPLHRYWSVIEWGRPAVVDTVTPTDEWVNIYCEGATFDDSLLPPGSVIRVFDPQGVLCGMGLTKSDGSYGFIPIYRDDVYTVEDEGALPGDELTITINGTQAATRSRLIWTENGDVIRLCHFTDRRCLEIELHEGWNLVSWNLAYSNGIEEAIAKISNCIDIVLSFDGGGLTYDPALPEFSTLLNVDYKHGYWFRMHCGATLSMCGNGLTICERIPISDGWNLISYLPDTGMTVENALGRVLDKVEVVHGFDEGALIWHPELDMFNTLTHMAPKFGYWVRAREASVLMYPVFCIADSVAGDPDIFGGAQPFATEPSRTWMSVYGKDLSVNGSAVKENDRFEFFTSEGVRCGEGLYGDGILKFTSVYGFDNSGVAAKTYPETGNEVYIRINGERVSPGFEWQGQGSRYELGKLTTGDGLPGSFVLEQNYPNPFNPVTEIRYSLPHSTDVTLTIFNIAGQQVATLVNENQEAGDHSVTWNATDDAGQSVASGIYLYRIDTEVFTASKKMILLK